ncbi:amino acid ABC transporter, amino acid-binding/permease protein [Lachnospiraceae bacterium KM106-2]|nr:amino acid ABC transporter, amino acid-binding/permease protein [Lachnospiraceae bacterium KM106-2]
MKKVYVLLLITSLVLGLVGCSSGKEDEIIVATEPGFAPYEYLDGNEVVGIDMDISKEIAKELGKKLVIKQMDFDGALQAAQSGKVDFVAAGVSVTEDRKKVMDFSDNYVDSTEVVVVNKSNTTIKAGKDKDGNETVSLDGMIVGVQQGNVADLWVEDNTKCKEEKRYTQFAQGANDLKNNKIDCLVMDQYPAEELVKKNDNLIILQGEKGNAILFQDQYAIATKKGNKEMLEKINKVIKKLKDEGKIEEFTKNHVEKK